MQEFLIYSMVSPCLTRLGRKSRDKTRTSQGNMILKDCPRRYVNSAFHYTFQFKSTLTFELCTEKQRYKII